MTRANVKIQRGLGTRFSKVFAALALVTGALVLPSKEPQAQPAPPAAEDPIGNFVVPAEASERPLPKVAIAPSLAPDMEDVTLQTVVRRDLELSGEFEVLPSSAAPEGAYETDRPIVPKDWQAKGAEVVVRVIGRKLSESKVELVAKAYVLSNGGDPVFEKRLEVPLDRVRAESHYVSDQIIGALTGTQGGFFSHLAFVSGTGTLRRIYRVDSDGFDARPVSPPDQVALAPAYGKDGELYWAGSVQKSEFKIYRASEPTTPIPTNIRGSIYGLGFSRDYSQVALSIGTSETVKIFSGTSFTDLKEASPIGLAFRPSFTYAGKLGFVGEGKFGQRVYVDGKAISPDGLMASAPTFCRHPDGNRAVFAVGVGKATDLVVAPETGGSLVRITQNMGSNSSPACSPDGRLVAFFSTRTTGEGPGLYVMRLDGGRPKRVSTLTGDGLRWDRLPPTKSVEKK